MFKKLNKKGFTLAELLVVVAIIGVLVAISIPIFTNQLEKSREAVDLANVRSAYAELTTEYLAGDNAGSSNGTSVKCEKKNTAWVGGTSKIADTIPMPVSAPVGGSYTVTITASGSVSVN